MANPYPRLSSAIRSYYERNQERERLQQGAGRLELARTRDILERHLPPLPASVLDIGGAAGVYACWLARAGYEVHLLDPVPLLVEQAQEASTHQPNHPLASCQLGDACHLPFQDHSADAVLLLGPLYHLTERADRALALAEAKRVLKPGGSVFAVAVSRFGSLLDGMRMGALSDPQFVDIVLSDLETGQHRNPTDRIEYFTDAYFHRPHELAEEIGEAGFTLQRLMGIEGPAWLFGDFDRYWNDEHQRTMLLDVLRRTETEPSLTGVSAHIMAVGQKPEGL